MKLTQNTQLKTLINTWLVQKRPMITPSTYANFLLIAENHLIPRMGKQRISSITEADIQNYINSLYNEGRLDKKGGLTVKTIHDVILVLRLCLIFAYKEQIIPMLNWDLIEYPRDFSVKKVISLSKDEEMALIQCIYMKMNRRSAGVLVALFTGIRIGMCIAKVLASINNIKLKAISSLNAYANVGKKIVILDAKANRVYVGIYNDNINVIDETVMEIDKFKELLDDYPDYEVVLDSNLIGKESSPIDVIENMNRISKSVKPLDNVDTLVPIYLKER